MTNINILSYFSALEDPRQSWKVIYPLDEIILVVLCGTMAGADDFVQIKQWSNQKIDFLRSILPFKHGVPSHDTLNDVMNAIPASLFSECFTNWVEAMKSQETDIVAIDGKTSRRARCKNGKALHVVSAWACQQRLVLGQETCDEKENEIIAIPRLLEKLELTGALVTIDAMGCQNTIAKAITDKGADYVLALKGNRKSLHEEVALFFENTENLESHLTTDADHGRIETRRSYVCHDIDWLKPTKNAPEEPRFPNLACVGMVESEVEIDGKTTTSRRYYVSSCQLNAPQLAKAVRSHWGVENRLHWVMDVVFHDDLMRLRTQNGPANMATIRHTALNLIKAIPGKASLRVKRKTMGWNEKALIKAVTQNHN